MSSFLNDTRAQTAGMLAVAMLTGAAFWAGEGLEAAIPPFVAIVVLTGVIALGRSRSDALSTMSGVGDERTRANYQRALAFAANVVAFVVPGWWLVTVAQGTPDDTLSGVAAIFGVSWVVAVVYFARRG